MMTEKTRKQADAMSRERIAACRSELQAIAARLATYEAAVANGANGWGEAGDLGYVLTKLRELQGKAE